jgi:hypothetical protein
MPALALRAQASRHLAQRQLQRGDQACVIPLELPRGARKLLPGPCGRLDTGDQLAIDRESRDLGERDQRVGRPLDPGVGHTQAPARRDGEDPVDAGAGELELGGAAGLRRQ